MLTTIPRHPQRTAIALLLALAGIPIAYAAPPHELPGYTTSPYFSEQIRDFTFDPDVLVEINAPAASAFDPAKPVRLVIFALPNGNTIAQTVGSQMIEGLDWHFDIQHIGAQTRLVRKLTPDANIVVAYVQAKEKSWPTWRKNHADSGAAIVKLVETLRGEFADMPVAVELTSHSGGGSMLFGFIEQVDEIPNWITRFVWLDSVYNYKPETHTKKINQWLRADPTHVLSVISYDDREAKYNGKPLVSPTGGTYRRTQEMVAVMQRDFQLKPAGTDDYRSYHDDAKRIELILLNNPDNKILHTVLVERNGFIHAVTLGTPAAEHAPAFWTDRAYSDWIQPAAPEPAGPPHP
ncbi:MAG TPA: hypothetical protein P5572_07505 [Phycisphaerae bacterium]|nr:hypothetical protein [Phycisphaerae bacterium]